MGSTAQCDIVTWATTASTVWIRRSEASGLDVVDFALTKALRPWMDFNLDLDNVANKAYYETQNFFESRVSPTAPAVERIHGTPGYPVGLTVGVTLHLGGK